MILKYCLTTAFSATAKVSAEIRLCAHCLSLTSPGYFYSWCITPQLCFKENRAKGSLCPAFKLVSIYLYLLVSKSNWFIKVHKFITLGNPPWKGTQPSTPNQHWDCLLGKNSLKKTPSVILKETEGLVGKSNCNTVGTYQESWKITFYPLNHENSVMIFSSQKNVVWIPFA